MIEEDGLHSGSGMKLIDMGEYIPNVDVTLSYSNESWLATIAHGFTKRAIEVQMPPERFEELREVLKGTPIDEVSALKQENGHLKAQLAQLQKRLSEISPSYCERKVYKSARGYDVNRPPHY